MTFELMPERSIRTFNALAEGEGVRREAEFEESQIRRVEWSKPISCTESPAVNKAGKRVKEYPGEFSRAAKVGKKRCFASQND